MSQLIYVNRLLSLDRNLNLTTSIGAYMADGRDTVVKGYLDTRLFLPIRGGHFLYISEILRLKY